MDIPVAVYALKCRECGSLLAREENGWIQFSENLWDNIVMSDDWEEMMREKGLKILLTLCPDCAHRITHRQYDIEGVVRNNLRRFRKEDV